MAQAVNAGYKTEIVNLAVNNATYTALTLSERPNNLLIRFRDAGDLYVSLDSVGTNYFTIKDTFSLTYDWNAGRATDILFLKGSINGTAEIIVTYE